MSHEAQLGQGQQPLNTNAIISAMASLHQQLELGNVTEQQSAARNRAYLAALQTTSPQFRLLHPHHLQIPITPTGFPSALPLPIWWSVVPHMAGKKRERWGAGQGYLQRWV